MFAGGVGDGFAGEHAGDLFDAFRFCQLADLHGSAAAVYFFADGEVAVCKRGDLRLVGDAEDLLRFAELF